MGFWVSGHAKTSIQHGPWDEHIFNLYDDGVRHGSTTLGTLQWRCTAMRAYQVLEQLWQIDDTPLGGRLSVRVKAHNAEYDFALVLIGRYGYWFGRPKGHVDFDWSSSHIEGKSLTLQITV